MTRRPSFFRSVAHALRGLAVTFRSGRNFRVQVLAAVLVLCAAVLLDVRIWELILLLLLSTAVLVLELFNSVIERMADGLAPRLQPIVRDIKDLMAGAVLLSSIAAAVIGLLIFLPYLLRLVTA